MSKPVKVEILVGTNNLTKGLEAATVKSQLLEGSLKRLQGVVGSLFTVHAALRFVESIQRVRSEIESLSVSFETLMGSQQKASQFFGQLMQYKLETPFSIVELAKSAQTLLGFNVPEDNLLKVIRQIGDTSMANVERFKSLTLAYAQMSSAGRLLGQDLLQMVAAGFNPLIQMSKDTGKSMAQLRDEMHEGAITSEMVAEAFANATAKGGKYHNMLEKQSKTMKGMIANLKGTIDVMLNELGEANQETFNKAISGATTLVKNYEAVGKALMALISTYGAYKAAVIATIVVQKSATIVQNIRLISMLRKEIGLLTAAQQAFNLTAKANPYILLGTAILSLISYMVIYSNKVRGMQVELDRVNDREREFAEIQRQKKDAIEEAIDVLKDDNAVQEDRIEALRTLKELMPSVFGQYQNESEIITNLTRVREAYNQKLRDEHNLKNIGNLKEDKQRLSDLNEYKKLIEKQTKSGGKLDPFDEVRRIELERKYGKEIQDAKSRWYSSTMTGVDNLIKATTQTVESGVDAIRTAQHDKFVAHLNSLDKEQVDASVSLYRSLFNQAKKDGKAFVQVAGEDIDVPLKEIAHRMEISQRRASYLAENATKDFLADAKKSWESAKAKIKEIVNNKNDRSLYPDEAAYQTAIKKARKEEIDTRLKYELYGGVTKEKKIKPSKTDYDREIKEQKEHIIAENKKAELEIRAAAIEAKEDGIEKEKETIALNYDRLLEENRKRRQEYVKQLQKLSDIEYYKANPKAKEKGIKAPTVTENDLSLEQIDNLKAFEEAAKVYKTTAEAKLYRSLIDKYKDYEDQRTEILRKAEAERKIIRESSQSEAQKTADLAKLEKYLKEQLRQVNDQQLNDLKRDNTALVSLFADTSEKSIREIQAIIDKVETLMDYLEAIKDEEGTALLKDGTKITTEKMAELGFSPSDLKALSSSPEKIKEITDAVRRLKQEVSGHNPFAGFARSIKEGIALLKDNKPEQGLGKIHKAVNNIIPVVKDLGSSLGAIFGKSAQSDIDKTVETLGAIAGGAIGIGKIATGDMSGILDVAKSVGYFFNLANEAASKHHEAIQKVMAQTIAQQREYNLLLMEQGLLYKQGNTIFGEDAYAKSLNAVEQARKAHEALIKEIKGTEDQKRKFSYSWIESTSYSSLYSKQKHDNAGLADIWVKIDHFKGTIWNFYRDAADVYGSLLDVFPDLIDAQGNFNKELAQSIVSTQEFSGEGKEALEGLIKLYEQQEKALEEVRNHLSQIFGQLGDEITNALVDAFRNVSDASKRLISSVSGMLEQFVNQMVYSLNIAPLIKQAEEEMLKIQKNSGLSTEQRIEGYTEVLADLMDSVLGKQGEVNTLLEKVKEIGRKRGLKLYERDDAEEQKGRAGAFTSATQDVMLKVEGLFTAMLIRQASVQSGVENIGLALSSALGHLKRIEDHTGASSETLRDIARELRTMKDDIGSIKRDGLKTK